MSRVSRAVTNTAAGRAATVRTCEVLSVREDGTVNLNASGATLLAVPCMDSYTGRAAGDQVKVLIVGQQWYVMGRVGDGAQTDPFKRTEIGWGQGSPNGAGWKHGVVYVRETSGAYEVYVDTDAAAIPPADPQQPGGGASAAPDPVTLTPTWKGTWRGSSLNGYSSAPTQGDWTGRGDQRGGWGYGDALHNAVIAHPVKKIELRLSRSGNPHGYYRRIPIHVRLHSASSRPGNLGLGNDEWTPFGLDVGESRVWTITGSALGTIKAALTAGSRGFGIKGSGRSDYLIGGSGIGWVKVFYQ